MKGGLVGLRDHPELANFRNRVSHFLLILPHRHPVIISPVYVPKFLINTLVVKRLDFLDIMVVGKSKSEVGVLTPHKPWLFS